MNKKGNTLQLWIEVVLFIALFLGIVAIIGADMNEKYGVNNDLTLGLNLSTQLSDLQTYSSETQNDTTSGTTSITDFGVLKLMTTPAILLTAVNIIWSFVSGSFIYNLIGSMHLGAYTFIIALIFRVLYVLAIAFILIKLVLRMNA